MSVLAVFTGVASSGLFVYSTLMADRQDTRLVSIAAALVALTAIAHIFGTIAAVGALCGFVAVVTHQGSMEVGGKVVGSVLMGLSIAYIWSLVTPAATLLV